jgi:hypothetical protein
MINVAGLTKTFLVPQRPAALRSLVAPREYRDNLNRLTATLDLGGIIDQSTNPPTQSGAADALRNRYIARNCCFWTSRRLGWTPTPSWRYAVLSNKLIGKSRLP